MTRSDMCTTASNKNLTPLAKKSHLHFEIKKLEISVVKLEGRSRNKWEDTIKMHIKGNIIIRIIFCRLIIHPFKNIIAQIKSDEWSTCTEALSKLRRIVYYHNELLTQQVIKIVIPEILRLI
jgi:hypothetical protein